MVVSCSFIRAQWFSLNGLVLPCTLRSLLSFSPHLYMAIGLVGYESSHPSPEWEGFATLALQQILLGLSSCAFTFLPWGPAFVGLIYIT